MLPHPGMINSQKRFQSGKIVDYNCSFNGLNQQRTSIEAFIKKIAIFTPDRWQWKMLILSTNVDKKSLETEFSIASCHPTGDNWQLKTLFLAMFDPRSWIVKSVYDCCLSGAIFLLFLYLFHIQPS